MDACEPPAEGSDHAWLRWASVWHAVFAAALLLGVLVALVGDAPMVAALTVASALWVPSRRRPA